MDLCSEETLVEDEVYGKLVAQLEELQLLQEIAIQQGVNREAMEWVKTHYPSSLPDHYPPSTFTLERSQQNLSVALESIKISHVLATIAIGGLLGGIVMALVKLFRSDNVETRMSELDTKQKKVSELSKKYEQQTKEMDKLVNVLSPEFKKEWKAAIDVVSVVNEKWYTRPFHVSDYKTKEFIYSFLADGRFYMLLKKWAPTMSNRRTAFASKVADLREGIESMYIVNGNQKTVLIDRMYKIQERADRDFIDQMDLVINDMLSFYDRSYRTYTDYMRERVVSSDTFISLAADEKYWNPAIKNFLSFNNVQINKVLERLEHDANRLLKGKESNRNAKVMDIDPELQEAIRRAEITVRHETKALYNYRLLINRILIFYDDMLRVHHFIITQRQAYLDKIYNDLSKYRR